MLSLFKISLVAVGCFTLSVTAYKVIEKTTTDSSLAEYKIGEMSHLELESNPKPMDPIKVVLEDGSDFTIDDKANKVRLINIWATWCAPCIKEMPALDRLQEKLGGDDFEVVTVSVDRQGPEKAREFLDKLDIKHLKIYSDPTMATAYTYSDGRLPMSHIVDKEGKIVASYLGPLEWDSQDAVALFTHLISKGKGED